MLVVSLYFLAGVHYGSQPNPWVNPTHGHVWSDCSSVTELNDCRLFYFESFVYCAVDVKYNMFENAIIVCVFCLKTSFMQRSLEVEFLVG